MAILELRQIRRSFDKGHETLKGVSLSLEPGETLVLLGHPGAGKTSLLRIALGLIEPHRGGVRIFGLDPFRQPVEVRRRLGYVAEEPEFPRHLHAGGVIDLHRRLFPTWDRDLERQLLRRFEFDDDPPIHSLDRAQRLRLALLCALAHRPELLLVDETGGGIRPSLRRELLELARDDGASFVFATHLTADLELLAGRAAVLHRGRVVLERELEDGGMSCLNPLLDELMVELVELVEEEL